MLLPASIGRFKPFAALAQQSCRCICTGQLSSTANLWRLQEIRELHSIFRRKQMIWFDWQISIRNSCPNSAVFMPP
jgi:hypothetical protein